MTLYLVAILLSATVGLLALRDSRCAPWKKQPIRYFQFALCFYFTLLYSLALFYNMGIRFDPVLDQLLLSGTLSRVGVVLLLGVTFIDIYFSSRKCQTTS